MAEGTKREFTSAPPYKFNYGQPGHFVEIYLPKKAVYQGALYDALTEGFHHEKVKQHFIDNADQVRKFLEGNVELFGAFEEQRYKDMDPCYFGYSLYELDGVFLTPKIQTASLARSASRSSASCSCHPVKLSPVPKKASRKSRISLPKGTFASGPKTCPST